MAEILFLTCNCAALKLIDTAYQRNNPLFHWLIDDDSCRNEVLEQR